MSVQSQIDRVKGNVSASYDAVEQKGGVRPENQNSDNLPQAIQNIPQKTGEDGFSPIVEMIPAEGGTNLKITDKTGAKETLIKDGESGVYFGDTAPEDPEIKVWIREDGNTTTIPIASSDILGGVKADPATQEDTQAVHIVERDGRLYTTPALFVIKLSGNFADKTFEEIEKAYKAGRVIVAEEGPYFYNLVEVNPGVSLQFNSSIRYGKFYMVLDIFNTNRITKRQKFIEPSMPGTANANDLGLVKANPATEEDIQPVNIGEGGFLYTKPGSGSLPTGGSEGDFLRFVGGKPAWQTVAQAKGVSF